MTAPRSAIERLRAFALALPEAWEDHPWGDTTFKVRKKIFAFCEENDDGLHLSVKLPESSEAALTLEHTAPTGYGLGRAGWVSASFPPGVDVPVDVLEDWIEESYRAIAPKSLVRRLEG